MYSIALLIPVCSRNQNFINFDDIPFLKYFLPSFLKTHNPNYNYTFYIGIDNTDEFYMKNIDNFHKNYKLIYYKYIKLSVIILQDCEHKPAWAWNKLFEIAYNNHDYFYQIGDDIIMVEPWIDKFIEILLERNNIGVVGGCNYVNYYGRLQANKSIIIENAFVHQKHYQIFNTFFNKNIENWYCDDWITEVYKPYSTHCLDIKIINKIYDRYKVKSIDDKIQTLINDDKKILLTYIN